MFGYFLLLSLAVTPFPLLRSLCTGLMLSPASALMASNNAIYKSEIHRSQEQYKNLFYTTLGLQPPCFLWSLAGFQGHVGHFWPWPSDHHSYPKPLKQRTCLSYSHLLCGTSKWNNLLGLSFILCHKISQKASCVSPVTVDLFFLV